MNIAVMPAEPADAKRLAEVFNASFYSDYLRYGECPGYHKTEADILAGMRAYAFYKLLADGAIVGAASVHQDGAERCFLGALCVVPDYADRKIGQRAMAALDAAYPNAKSWALETPADKVENLYFYRKLGFQVTREYQVGRVRIALLERG